MVSQIFQMINNTDRPSGCLYLSLKHIAAKYYSKYIFALDLANTKMIDTCTHLVSTLNQFTTH